MLGLSTSQLAINFNKKIFWLSSPRWCNWEKEDRLIGHGPFWSSVEIDDVFYCFISCLAFLLCFNTVCFYVLCMSAALVRNKLYNNYIITQWRLLTCHEETPNANPVESHTQRPSTEVAVDCLTSLPWREAASGRPAAAADDDENEDAWWLRHCRTASCCASRRLAVYRQHVDHPRLAASAGSPAGDNSTRRRTPVTRRRWRPQRQS